MHRSTRRTRLALALAIAAAATPEVAAAQQREIAVDLGKSVSLRLVLVKGGTFQQGSPPSEPGRGPDEAQREVTIGRDFYIGRAPVTRGQFARFVDDSGYRTEAERGGSGGHGFDGTGLVQRKEFTWRSPGFPQADDHPVTIVTYDDALAFTDWLSKKSGRAVSLPTEAQFEYAQRAGTRTRFYTGDGDENAALVGWFKGNAGNGTRPVGQKLPNAFGLVDTAGNVWQWCRDWYAPYTPGPVKDPEQAAPVADGDKPRRVLRGGSWLKDAKNLRSAARFRSSPGSRNADYGFRVVASVEAGKGTTSRSESWSDEEVVMGLVVLGGALAFVVGVLVAMGLVLRHVLRRGGERGAARNAHRGIRLHPGVDGFWIQAQPRHRGSTILYVYTIGGRTMRASAVFEPSPRGQFVYTGGTPGGLAIEQVIPPAQPARGAAGWGRSHGHQRAGAWPNHDDTSTPFGGFPSAY